MVDQINLDDLIENLGLTIKKLVKFQSLTVNRLSERTSYTKGYIGNISRGAVQNPTLKVLIEIANALGTDVVTLLANASGRGDISLDQEVKFEHLLDEREPEKRKHRHALWILKKVFLEESISRKRRDKFAEAVILSAEAIYFDD